MKLQEGDYSEKLVSGKRKWGQEWTPKEIEVLKDLRSRFGDDWKKIWEWKSPEGFCFKERGRKQDSLRRKWSHLQKTSDLERKVRSVCFGIENT